MRATEKRRGCGERKDSSVPEDISAAATGTVAINRVLSRKSADVRRERGCKFRCSRESVGGKFRQRDRHRIFDSLRHGLAKAGTATDRVSPCSGLPGPVLPQLKLRLGLWPTDTLHPVIRLRYRR